MGKKHRKSQHVVNDNALKSALRTPLFKQRIVKPKKGKGAYSRKGRAPSLVGLHIALAA